MLKKLWPQWFAAGLLLCVSAMGSAAEVWYYDYLDLNQPQIEVRSGNEHHWVLAEFNDDPYPGQLTKLTSRQGFERATVLFHRSVSPNVAAEYAVLARAWQSRGTKVQFRFQGTFPNADEAKLLSDTCTLGVKIVFIANQIPTSYEAANLQSLKSCSEVDLVLGHFPKYDEVADLRALKGLPLVFVANHYPTSIHADVLNILNTPVGIWVTDSVPGSDNINFMNAIKKLNSQYLELAVTPTSEQYKLLEKLDRVSGRRLALRWAFGNPSAADLESWVKLAPSRLQLSKEAFESSTLSEHTDWLPGEILVENFQLIDRLGQAAAK